MQKQTGKYDGVDVNSSNGVQNAFEGFVWEPLQVKLNVYTAAAEVIFLHFEFREFEQMLCCCFHFLRTE